MEQLLTYLISEEIEAGLFGYVHKVTRGSGEPRQKSKSLMAQF